MYIGAWLLVQALYEELDAEHEAVPVNRTR
jgi:hypothetical protein